nr:MAG TPA: hypothetical protein [Caudoviricetes sp.]
MIFIYIKSFGCETILAQHDCRKNLVISERLYFLTNL